MEKAYQHNFNKLIKNSKLIRILFKSLSKYYLKAYQNIINQSIKFYL